MLHYNYSQISSSYSVGSTAVCVTSALVLVTRAVCTITTNTGTRTAWVLSTAGTLALCATLTIHCRDERERIVTDRFTTTSFTINSPHLLQVASSQHPLPHLQLSPQLHEFPSHPLHWQTQHAPVHLSLHWQFTPHEQFSVGHQGYALWRADSQWICSNNIVTYHTCRSRLQQ